MPQYAGSTGGLSSMLNMYPGGATATQTPYQVAGPGQSAFGAFGGLGALLARQLAMREQLQQAQLDAMRQQMAAAQEQAKYENIARQEDIKRAQRMEREERNRYRKQTERPFGLRRADTTAQDAWANAYGMAEALTASSPRGPSFDPNQTYNLARMIQAIGPQAAHQGMMQSGKLFAGQGGGTPTSPGQLRAQGMEYMPSQVMPITEAGEYGSSIRGYQQTEPTWQPRGVFEKGGRVPSTGAYKLHRGEVVVPRGAADVLFPYAMRGGGPPRSAGPPRGSYQGGTGALIDPRMLALTGGWTGAGPPTAAPQPDLPGLTRFLPQPYVPGGAAAMEPTAPLMPSMGEPVAQQPGALGIAGLIESRGRKGERKFELTGKPTTDRERLQQLDDQADRLDREADYHEGRLEVVLSYMGNDPTRITPEMQKLVQNRQRLSRNFRQREKEVRARADTIREQVLGAETMKEIATVEATGRTRAEEIKSLTAERERAQRAVQDLYSNVASALAKPELAKDEAAITGVIYAQMSQVIPYLAEAYGMSYAELDRDLRKLAAFAVRDPSQAIGALNALVLGGQSPGE